MWCIFVFGVDCSFVFCVFVIILFCVLFLCFCGFCFLGLCFFSSFCRIEEWYWVQQVERGVFLVVRGVVFFFRVGVEDYEVVESVGLEGQEGEESEG